MVKRKYNRYRKYVGKLVYRCYLGLITAHLEERYKIRKTF